MIKNQSISLQKLLVLFVGCLLISGCATMDKSECITADWRLLGYEDGAQGRTASMLSNRREACAKHGVTPVMDDYRLGYKEGLQQFCTEYNGFQKGSIGYQYQGICRETNENEFLAGYREGQYLYDLRQAVNEIQHGIDHKENEVQRLDKQIKKLRERVVSDESTREERIRLLDEIREMEYEIGALETEIQADLPLLVLAEQDYQEFRQGLSY